MFMLTLELLVFIYYFFVLVHLKELFLEVQNLCASIIQILFCYEYCQRSSRLLTNRKWWFKILKIIAIASIGINLVLIITSFVRHTEKNSIYASCTTDLFFAINFSQTMVLLFFCCVGFYLIQKINTYVPVSELERCLHENNKESSKFDLKVCLVTFITLIFV